MSATMRFLFTVLAFLPLLFFDLPTSRCFADGCCQLDTHRCMDVTGTTCPGGHTFFADSCCTGPPARPSGLCTPLVHGQPFGGDDTGFIPSRVTSGCFLKGADLKCELKISGAVQKLLQCVQKCHDSRAKGKLSNDTEEDGCETANNGKSCFAKYFKSTTTTIGNGGCPACVIANVPGIAPLGEAVLDVNNGMVYCASPSGAFVDAVNDY